jgi:hypothetical protein
LLALTLRVTRGKGYHKLTESASLKSRLSLKKVQALAVGLTRHLGQPKRDRYSGVIQNHWAHPIWATKLDIESAQVGLNTLC